MDDQRLHLGLPDQIDVESFGEPGNRTFRMFVGTSGGSVSLWLEKEQVVLLGSAIESVLEEVPVDTGSSPESDQLETFRGDLDLRVGSLSLSYDSGRSGFLFEATDLVSDIPLSSVSLICGRESLTRMTEQIDNIVSAGRPRCPLCGRPITAGRHFCPESNGHAPVAVSE